MHVQTCLTEIFLFSNTQPCTLRDVNCDVVLVHGRVCEQRKHVHSISGQQ